MSHASWRWFRLAACCVGCCAATNLPADEREAAASYAARDTLDPPADESPDAQVCLKNLVWKPGDFQVDVYRPEGDGPDAFVRFPSPVPSGDATNDLVAMEWYAPKTDDGKIARSSAMVVVHESGSRMEVGRMFAKAAYAKGFHAFLVQLPYYGLRRPKEFNKSDGSRIMPLLKQGIADVRRARDAVAALPEIQSDHIALQGTSLGGFVSATAAGLDRGFDQVFIMVAGGNLLKVIEGGEREAEQMRKSLQAAGYEGEKLRELASVVEPTRLAHRLNPQATWMYTAKNDQVVPWECALALQQAAKLPDEHHIQLWGDHYKVVVYFPIIVDHMAARMREFSGRKADPSE